MNEMITINYKNNLFNFPKGTSFVEISKSFSSYYKYEIVGVLIDNEINELSEKLSKTCFVDFVDLKSSVGSRMYERGLIYMYLYAVKMVLGNDADVSVEHSIDKGIYTVINKPINQYIAMEISKAMEQLIRENIPFERNNILRKEAIKYFLGVKRPDKAEILKYISNTYITLYKFKGMYDYFYGEMPYSSGTIREFKLDVVDDNGIVISYPNLYTDIEDIGYTHHVKLFETFRDYSNYQNRINVNTISDLNKIVSNSKISDLIRIDETFQNQRLLNVATQIADKKENIKVVLIAGPSSSGKTTTSKKLANYLQGLGLNPHPISLDDFFKEKYETPKDEKGDYDFESINAIDTELFNSTFEKLLSGEETLIPTFNFVVGKKEFKNRLKINSNDVLIVEGLHALNEKLTSKIDADKKFKIYISPLTDLNIDNSNRIHTTDTRLLRRMVRDNKTRGNNASMTIKTWADVRRGEEHYVFPYQDNADVVFNTAFVYELGVLKTYVEPLLFSVDVDDPGYSEALRLINFLRKFLPIPSDDVPSDSLLREFIGNGSFKL